MYKTAAWFLPAIPPACYTLPATTPRLPLGKLLIELAGTTAGTQYDQLIVTGAVTLDGTLQVSLINGFNPALGNTFDVLDWGTLSGTFSSLQLPSLSGAASLEYVSAVHDWHALGGGRQFATRRFQSRSPGDRRRHSRDARGADRFERLQIDQFAEPTPNWPPSAISTTRATSPTATFKAYSIC